MTPAILIVALKKELDELKISAEQKEGLEDRIDRKIIFERSAAAVAQVCVLKKT